MPKSKHYERTDRKAWVVEDIRHHGPCLTAKTIAELQGLKKAPGILSIIQELVDDGVIIVQWGRGSNRQATRYYSLPSQAPELIEVK